MVTKSSVNLFITLLCLAVLISTGHSYLSCYRCKSDEPEVNCTNTNITHLPQDVCRLDQSNMDHYSSAMDKELWARDISNATAFCFSYYYKDTHDERQTGIYRGCYFATTASVCQELSEDLGKNPNKNGTVTECHVCNTNNCNTHHINGSTISMAFPSLLLAFLSILICKF